MQPNSTQTAADSIAARFANGGTGDSTPPVSAPAGNAGSSVAGSIAARFANAPAETSTPAEDNGSFTTPNGTTFTPGQTVTHSSGITGTVTGQHPDTGKAIIDWAKNHPGQKYGVEGNLTANDPNNVGGKVARWAEQVSNDLKYGTDITGIGKFLKKMGAHGLYVGSNEDIGNFMGSIPLGILRGVKGAAESVDPQSTGGSWQAVKDMVGGLAQTSEMPSMVVAPESSELEDLAGQAVDHAGELASAASKAGKIAASKVGDAVSGAASKATSPVSKTASRVAAKAKDIVSDLRHPDFVGQDELQQGVQDIAKKAADEAGARGGVGATGNPTNPIQPTPATSIRDVFRNLAQAVETRAQSAYQELDAATGGNVSRFDKELKNVENAIRNSTGVDESTDAALEARRSSIIEKQKQAFKQAEENGIPREKVEQARADWRQKSALNDLDTHLKKSTPVSSNPADTRIDPNKFRTRITNMHDSGRLHEAVGADNAEALRDAAVKAAETQAKAIARQKLAKTVGKTVGYGTGAGLIGDIVKHAVE